MTSVVSGKFAEVFEGNGTWGWLPEGDDLQERANANIDPYWMTECRNCPIGNRNVEGHAVVVTLPSGKLSYKIYTSKEAAERAARNS